MTILKEGAVKTYIYECGECGCVFTGDSTEIDTWDNMMGIFISCYVLPVLQSQTCLRRCCDRGAAEGYY